MGVNHRDWAPPQHGRPPGYRAIAEAAGRDIRTGRLPPGARLPTLRDLAFRLGVTVGTAKRAFDQLERQGLVSRHVGRGTFVASEPARRPQTPVVGRVARGIVDLTLNRPAFVDCSGLLSEALGRLGRNPLAWGMMDYQADGSFGRHREGLAEWLLRAGVTGADPARIVLTAGAEQGISATLAAVTSPGDAILADALTYPGVKNLARMFGLSIIPVASDAGGIIPAALHEACGTRPSPRILFLMPRVHNPTTRSMTPGRLEQVAEVACRADLTLIEDDVYNFDPARPWRPVATLCPERTVYISSLSKTVAPGLRLGIVLVPAPLVGSVAGAAQTLSWMIAPLMAELALGWVADGTASLIAERRRHAAQELQRIAAGSLDGLGYEADPGNTHLWLHLPGAWTAPDFAEAAARSGAAVTPAGRFAVSGNVRCPEAVRLALGGPVDVEELGRGLGVVSRLAKGGPDALYPNF